MSQIRVNAAEREKSYLQPWGERGDEESRKIREEKDGGTGE